MILELNPGILKGALNLMDRVSVSANNTREGLHAPDRSNGNLSRISELDLLPSDQSAGGFQLATCYEAQR